MKERQSGVLMHISSLPGKYGIGSFGKSAYDFVDFLVRTKQRYWQILPLGTTSYGDSPYQSFSAFAGNTHFIDFDRLIEEGLLTESDIDGLDFGQDPRKVDYAKVFNNRRPVLEKAVKRFLERGDLAAYEKFVADNASWLEVFAEYMAIKEHFDLKAWTEWPDAAVRRREASSLATYREKLADRLTYHRVTQYLFFKQWLELKNYANEHHIEIVGDMPIYVAADSCDVWAQPHFFKTDELGQPTCVAGCPPDGFSATGQLWGNPLYRWDVHKNTGFEWWIKRLAHCFNMYDVVRIDHFRGFDEYYAIPYGDKDAKRGWWEKGPGMDLFRTVSYRLGHKDIIAEDLGFMTDSVKRLVEESGYPNMKVIEFAFDERDTGNASDYLPHNYTNNCVVYTGTHDNETLLGWYGDITPEERHMVREYLWNFHDDEKGICRNMIRLVMGSVAGRCIIPIQDYLQLGNSARINQPSTLGTNWKWRLKEGQFSKELQKEMLTLATRFGRKNWTPDPVEEKME